MSAHTTSVGGLCSRCVCGQRHPPAGWRREPQDGCGVGPNEVLDNALLHADIPALVAHLNCVVHVHTHIQCVQSVEESDTVHTAAAADPLDHTLPQEQRTGCSSHGVQLGVEQGHFIRPHSGLITDCFYTI